MNKDMLPLEEDFLISHMAFGLDNLSLVVANNKGNIRIFNFKDTPK